MPALFCHSCQRQFAVPANTGECPACGGGFVEEVAQPQAGSGATGGPQQSFSRTFALPGGRGAVQIVTSTGGHGGGAPVDPFVQGVLEAVMGGGFMQPGSPFMGMPPGMVPGGGMPGGGMGPGGEQDWLDGLMSQIMADYQPPSQATAQRAVRSLPVLAVRGKEARGEPEEGQAVARAGEPCSVCHDEYREGEEVLELPCQHNFHSDCLLPWLETHNTCPVCRHELPAEDPGVEAARRQRAGAVAGAASTQPRGRPGAQQERPPSTNRLADLLQNISARWSSLHSESSGEGLAAAGSVDASSSGAASGRAPAPASASSGSLRQRRDTAAAAAERRLHGEPSGRGPVASASQRAAPRPAPPTSAAAPVQQAAAASGSDGLVAGAVAGGVLGALVGGALMLLGGAGRRRDADRR